MFLRNDTQIDCGIYDTHKHTDVHTHVCISTHQHACVGMHTHTNRQICTQTQMAIHEQACIYTHTHTHIHTHTQYFEKSLNKWTLTTFNNSSNNDKGKPEERKHSQF